MTDELAVQTAVEPYGRPRPDQLPEGWGVMSWRVTTYRDQPFENVYEIACDFGHVSGARAYFEAKFRAGTTVDFEWLRRYLVAVQDIPREIRIDAQRETHWWER